MEVWREPRIPMQLRVEVHGLGPQGPYQENAYTVNVSRNGARLIGSRYSQHPGDTVELRRGKDKARYQVVWVGEPGTPVHGQVGVRSLDPVKNIWSAPLPPPPQHQADTSLPVRPTASAPSTAEPPFSSAGESHSADASGASLYTHNPFSESEDGSLDEPGEAQPDTVSYGPELLPEQYITASAPLPLHKRPILYVGLGLALVAGLGLGWLRSRGAGDESTTAVATAEASTPATVPAESQPSAPPPQIQPAAQPPSTAATQAPAPAPKKEPAPVEAASRTQPAPVKPTAATSTAAETSSSFAVQVGAYGSAATARSLAKKLSSRYDRKSLVDRVDSGGKTLHRVRLLTPSEADAKALVARIRREQKLDAIVVRPD